VDLFVGWLYAWRGNLLAPILMHALSDSLGLLFISRAAASARDAANQDTRTAAAPPVR